MSPVRHLFKLTTMISPESTVVTQNTSANGVLVSPSIYEDEIIHGTSYTYHSAIPSTVASDMSIECVLGIDEAGRGPVLGPMVYGLLYLPIIQHQSLLAEMHHFDDSKVLTPEVRSQLFRTLCSPDTDLYRSCGWATRVMSAQDISAGMLRLTGGNNLNTQAMDATIQLIKEVSSKGVNLKEIYVDTIGSPATYQRKLERIFPTITITVAKKADSLYPCVSAASVCAKVTRDAALEASYCNYPGGRLESAAVGWGSGYPSDGRTSSWMKSSMDPFFGWGNECRFSWSTTKDLLESTPADIKWLASEEDQISKLTDFFNPIANTVDNHDELKNWFGSSVAERTF